VTSSASCSRSPLPFFRVTNSVPSASRRAM
jgi:hypothetical protein